MLFSPRSRRKYLSAEFSTRHTVRPVASEDTCQYLVHRLLNPGSRRQRWRAFPWPSPKSDSLLNALTWNSVSPSATSPLKLRLPHPEGGPQQPKDSAKRCVESAPLTHRKGTHSNTRHRFMLISCFKGKPGPAQETRLKSAENQYTEKVILRDPPGTLPCSRGSVPVLPSRKWKVCTNVLGNLIMWKFVNDFEKYFPFEINGTMVISQLHV